MPYRPQSANRLTERLHAAVRSVVAGVGDSNLLVACSGGTDSVCLAHAVVAVGRQNGWAVTIAHVRHGVRPGDSEDVAAVGALAARLNAAFVHESLIWPRDVPPANVSEAALRAGRYAALARMARLAGARAILTGHTMDDQAETMLLHLIRGAGLAGLAGMKANRVLPVGESDDADGADDCLHLVRPLLSIRREETATYCVAHDLPVIHDPSNADQTWTRNWLRHTVLPELRTRNPDIAQTLSRAAGLFAEDAEFFAEETQRAFVRAGLRHDAMTSVIDYRAFASESPAVRIRMVRSLLERYSDTTPRADLVIDADTVLSTARSSRIMHFGMMACAVIDGQLIVGAPHNVRQWIIRWSAARFPLFHGSHAFDTDESLSLHLSGDSALAYDCTVQSLDMRSETLPRLDEEVHYLALPADARLTVRNRLPGDQFQPVGRPRAVALSDYLSGRGVPTLVRDWLPLLVVNDTIAWAIGHDVGAAFAASRECATHIALLQRRAR